VALNSITIMSHIIKINTGSVRFLRDMLSATGWAKTTSDIILGGGLLVSTVPEVPEPPAQDNKLSKAEQLKVNQEWAATPVPEFSVSEKEREAIRKCVKHFAEQGAIPPNKQGADLLVAFGFSTEG
jgi:hypothetical protein